MKVAVISKIFLPAYQSTQYHVVGDDNPLLQDVVWNNAC
jgi:hypothetical protein